MTQQNAIVCPVEACPTVIQRDAGGDLIGGVTAHLSVVHRKPAAVADAIARKAVRSAP